MMQEDFSRTDLACEWGRGAADGAGVRTSQRTWSHGTVQTLCINTDEAAQSMGRERGEYITFHCGQIWHLDGQAQRALEEVVAKTLWHLLQKATGKREGRGMSVLVAGLGNRDITADALGPMAVRELLVTRHLREQEPAVFRKMNCCSVAALAPGVLGQTGMEVKDVVAGAVRRSGADVIVAIDALAARSCERLAATVQLSDAGISPGAGIGNGRTALSRQTMGVPVVALGIPTVVDSSTLVYEALQKAGIREVDERLRRLLENGKRFYVSPKEADLITQRTASLVARAINRALVGVASLND